MPAALREITRNCIEQHVDQFQLEQLKVVEEAERATLSRFAAEVAVA
jgi:hypothetical protein